MKEPSVASRKIGFIARTMIDIRTHGLFWTKFNSEQLLLEALFDAMCIFGNVEL